MGLRLCDSFESQDVKYSVAILVCSLVALMAVRIAIKEGGPTPSNQYMLICILGFYVAALGIVTSVFSLVLNLARARLDKKIE